MHAAKTDGSDRPRSTPPRGEVQRSVSEVMGLLETNERHGDWLWRDRWA